MRRSDFKAAEAALLLLGTIRCCNECEGAILLNMPTLPSSYSQRRKPQERKDYEKTRLSSSRRGYGSRWRKYRLWYLKRHPICNCGCGHGATDVDHIQPVSGKDDPLFWDESNHQALAHKCHSRKTRKEVNARLGIGPGGGNK